MSLFVCPNCGFEDLPIWKSCAWQIYSVYCHMDELETFLPEIAEKLKRSIDGWLYEKPYYYKLTRTGVVYRMTQVGRDAYRQHGFTEKPKDPFQTKLR